MKDVDVNVEAFFESQYFRGGKVFFADQVTDKDLELLMGTEVAPPEAAIEEFQNNNQTFMDIDPDAANHFLTKKMLLNQKMALSKPKQEDILKNTKVFREDTAEDRKAKMISNLSRNPAAIIKQIGRGFITNEGAEILQTVYPRIHQLIYEKMMEKATDSYFTPRQKMEFKKLFGGSMDASLSPIGMGILQSIHNRSNIEEQEVMENSSSTKRPFRKRSSGNQTDIERRNNR